MAGVNLVIENIHIKNNEAIFDTIASIDREFIKIKSSLSYTKYLVIIFDSEIKFINPLFFSLLLQIHEKYTSDNIVLAIDALNFIQDEKYKEYANKTDPRQHYVQRILLSAMDMPYFESFNVQTSDIKSFRDKYRVHIKNIIKGNKYKDSLGRIHEKFVVLLYNRKHNDTIFLTKEEDKQYKLLPIIKLTNFPEFIYDNDLTSNEFDTRKKIYESITITDNEKYDSSTLKESFEKNFIGLVKSDTNKHLNKPLRDIFFEMLDNIKRHAQYDNGIYADSYFNFYYDVPAKTFKFHIIDNLETGFINTYIKTLNHDMKKLEKKGLETKEFYDTALKKLKDPKNDEEFLELFFSEYGWFQANKIPRIILHFGIPLLVDIIKKTYGQAYIRLHRTDVSGDKFYIIKINHSDVSVNEIIEESKQIKGTYITIDIPEKYLLTRKNPLRPSSVVRSFGKTDFEKLKNEKKGMIELVKRFVEGTKKNEYAIYDYSEYREITISDFIRKIYIESHQNKITDILVVDISLRENMGYFKTLVYLLYHKDYTKQDDFLPINILFWDKSTFDIFFVGGKDRYEFCKSYELLYGHYGQKNNYTLDELCLELGDNPAKSVFFVGAGESDFIVLPLELLIEDIENKEDNEDNEVWKKLSYKRVIVEHLNENKVNDIHFDTQRGYHVDGFYRFDTIFQSSQFLERLIYVLSEQITNDTILQNKKLAFIGFGKYLNLFIALLIDNLKKKGVDIYEKYNVVNEHNTENKKMEIYIRKMNENDKNHPQDLFFITISSVLFDGAKTSKFLKKHIDSKRYKWYSLIQIILQHNSEISSSNDITSLVEVEISDNLYYDLNRPCPICSEPDNEKPLLRIDQNDGFKLEKTYFEKYKEKQFSSTVKVNDAKFYNATAFGHIKRGENNHYLYYTKTVNFFEDNKDETKYNKEKNIKDFLGKINLIENPSNAVLLLPMHCTVNRFASMVYTSIFNGEANIFQFDKRKGIKNFHELKRQLDPGIEYKFYFIDDEISSGYTLEYFYSLIQYAGADSFEKIFILIDRTDSIDEKIILNFIKNRDKHNVHIFSKMEIKPIKTEIEQCFLCEKRDIYKEILKDTLMDINRFAIANRIAKLNIQDSKLYDFEELKKFNKDDFRRYLKMYAVDYIYNNFKDIYLKNIENKSRYEISVHYEKIEKEFIDKVQEKIKGLPQFENTKYGELLDKIGEYEGKIVFLKALSLPKLAYYYSIRKMITVVIIDRIREYIQKDAIDFIFDQMKMKKFLSEQTKKNYKIFITHFSNKINMNYLSFLYKTASYLDIHYVIHSDNVKYYFEATEEIKKHDKDDNDAKEPYLNQSLVEYYQLAAKMVASYSEDRAKYLKDNIDEVFEDNSRAEYKSLLSALWIENHYEKRVENFQDSIKNIFKSDENFDEVILNLENELKSAIEDDDLKIYSLYINQHTDRTYETYSKYLQEIVLVDIVNDFRQPYKTDEAIEEHLVKGYLSKRKGKKFQDDQFYREHIHNTWSNLYVSEYIMKDNKKTKATLVKLVDINPDNLDTDINKKVNEELLVKGNSTLWYKPIGCIIITYNTIDKKKHLKLSKYLLSTQEEIVSYIKKKFSTGVIQESIEKQHSIHTKNVALEEVRLKLSNVRHNYSDNIKIESKIDKLQKDPNIDNEKIIELVKYYTLGLQYVFNSASLMKSSYTGKNNIGQLLKYKIEGSEDESFEYSLKKFTESLPFFLYKHDYKKQKFQLLEIETDSNNAFFCIEDDEFKIIIYELIFNGAKANRQGNVLFNISVKNGNLYVSNNGEPISREEAENIFVPKGSGKHGNGLPAIKKFLNDLNIEIDLMQEEIDFLREYKVVFKISNIGEKNNGS